MDNGVHFLPGVAAHHVAKRLRSAGGKEIESGKFRSPQSSAALAVNTFGWFVERPQLLPTLPGLEHVGSPSLVDVEYCARFPWRGGRHPWLDAIIETPTHLIGVESKRYEPFRDRKAVQLSKAYDGPVWGDGMAPFERMRDRLRSGSARFRFLDATQLVKHAFGIVTDARRRGRKPALFYLFAEPSQLGHSALPAEWLDLHREEIADFAEAVSGSEVQFAFASYREWFESWQSAPPEVVAHGQALVREFQP